MPRRFEQFPGEAGLAKPMGRRRVIEVVKEILSALPAMEAVDGTTEAISRLIGARCDQAKRLFTSRKIWVLQGIARRCIEAY
jgi:hypothetical protein